MADRLLGHVEAATQRERAAAGIGNDRDAWPWLDAARAPIERVLAEVVDRAVEDGSPRSECFQIAERLMRDEYWHSYALLEAMGCLIPRDLHPSLDGVKPKGKVKAGATTASVAVKANG